MRRSSLYSLVALLALALSACGGEQNQASNADLQATVAALQATVAAQRAPAATSAPAPTADASATPFQPQPASTTTAQVASTAATASTAMASAAASSVVSASSAPLTATLATAATSSTAVAASASVSGTASGDPTVFQPGGEGAAATVVNIELVFDASGSMAEDIGGQTKIAAARQALNRVIDQLPDSAPKLNVGFRVYGHKGDNSEARKAESCQSTELLAPIKGVDKNLLRQQTSAFEPTGWTPISLALQKAGEDLTAGDQVRNVIIMVTDGEETCDGDPCAVAAALAKSGSEVRIDVVGFGTAPEQDRNLRCITDNSGGSFINAGSADALAQTLQDLTSSAVQRSYLRIKAFDAQGQPTNQVKLDAASLVDQQGKPALDGKSQPIVFLAKDGTPDAIEPLADGETRVEIAPGTYQFSVDYGLFTSGATAAIGKSPKQTYTAIIAAGQETVALVGVGELKLVNAGGLPDSYPCLLLLERFVNNTWERIAGTGSNVCIRGQRLDFTEPAQLSPGRYRLLNAERNGQEVGEFAITPGKQITVQVQK